MDILVSKAYLLLCTHFRFVFQIFEDGATYHGRLKTLGRHIVKSFYSDMIFPNVDGNLNSDQYHQLVSQNVTGLLSEASFLLAREHDEQVRRWICPILGC